MSRQEKLKYRKKHQSINFSKNKNYTVLGSQQKNALLNCKIQFIQFV